MRVRPEEIKAIGRNEAAQAEGLEVGEFVTRRLRAGYEASLAKANKAMQDANAWKSRLANSSNTTEMASAEKAVQHAASKLNELNAQRIFLEQGKVIGAKHIGFVGEVILTESGDTITPLVPETSLKLKDGSAVTLSGGVVTDSMLLKQRGVGIEHVVVSSNGTASFTQQYFTTENDGSGVTKFGGTDSFFKLLEDGRALICTTTCNGANAAQTSARGVDKNQVTIDNYGCTFAVVEIPNTSSAKPGVTPSV